jgi:gallate dioxygenase
MARIIGGIAASHTPTIGFAFDKNKRDDPVWAPIFENFAPLAAWLADKRPDVIVAIYNDHITSFFFDHYSAFALGVGAQWPVADEGGGARDLPPIDGHPRLAAHIGKSLMTEEFYMSFFQGKTLDHGCFSPLSMLCPHEPEWPVKLVPLQMGVLQLPMPNARRFYKLGHALRRAIESYPEDLKVAILATGGLSHQVHGERAGFNNVEWDQRFLDFFGRDPEQLAEMTIAEYAALGGYEGAEVVMWLTMRGALSANVVCKHRSYYLPSMAGIATAIYEGEEGAANATGSGWPFNWRVPRSSKARIRFRSKWRCARSGSTSICTSWSSRLIARRSSAIPRRASRRPGCRMKSAICCVGAIGAACCITA